jgi:AbrB family looped-hinge helix DNA binding protein
MQVVKVGSKGQVSIPKNILERLGIRKETTMLVELVADGAIVLRPAGVYPIEIYSEERLREFAEADRLSSRERQHLARVAGRRKR